MVRTPGFHPGNRSSILLWAAQKPTLLEWVFSYICKAMSSLKKYLSLIKFSHTIFAMPFALIGFFLGYNQSQEPFNALLLILVTLCMIFARSAAMAFNRYIDRDIDLKNPRTASLREFLTDLSRHSLHCFSLFLMLFSLSLPLFSSTNCVFIFRPLHYLLF